ncbi:fimbrial protein [Pseudomonas aeruginosa]
MVPDLNTNVPGLSVRLLLDGIPASDRFKGTFANRGDPVVPQLDAALRRPVRESGAFNSYFLITYKDGLIASGTSSIRLTGSVTTINATCQVADQTVKLQSIAAARLNGVGTYAAVTPFNLVVAGCPRGYNRVGYSLQAVGARWPKARVYCRAWRAAPRPAYRSGSPTRPACRYGWDSRCR